MPTFISTVEIGEDSFLGQAAKSNKAADMNAAKVAYFCLQFSRLRLQLMGKSMSPEFFPTIKEAKHVTAKVAWESLSPNEVTEDDLPVYNNLLQEVCQKKGFVVLKYERTISDPPYMPTFISTVEIEEGSFLGQAAKSKKAAYMNATKVAYFCLQ
ncbi:Double-stranded RNA-binding protein 4 [Camellia lanceoleosa]|uniref:Double-stranded RNA-binding protein 4 n=1 Tax=Camellia lanceoleosa TaxID=1840588 RepID=A0ACC0IUZ6_9ERIC|nr:Double-stranded RNA-binding protein 4 [Camellia lanceoleosa]